MSVTLTHSDECSGMTIMDDATVYWTEGYSEAVIKYADGRIERINAWAKHPILQRPEVFECATDEARPMTADEEAEWEMVRYGSQPEDTE